MLNYILDLLQEIVFFFNEIAIYLVFGFLIAGILHVLFPEHFITRHIGKNDFKSVLKATFGGIPLPLCSCGVIPVAASLRRKGASRGATLSFLVATPQIGVDSFLVTYSLIGWLFGVFRIIASFITALVSGVISNITGKKEEIKQVDPSGEQGKRKTTIESTNNSFGERLQSFFSYIQVELLGSFANYLVIGFIIAAAITVFVPESFFEMYLSNSFLSMLIMLVVGIPMYVCATSSTPIAASLLFKGISPGAALVFLLAGPATNAIAISTIVKTMGKRAAIIYVGSIAVISILLGYALNFVTSQFQLSISHPHQHDVLPLWLQVTGSVLLLGMLLLHYVRNWFFSNKPTKNNIEQEQYNSLNVSGMTCNHCAENVKRAVASVEGTENIIVDLQNKKVHFQSKTDRSKDVKEAIEEKGYEIIA